MGAAVRADEGEVIEIHRIFLARRNSPRNSGKSESVCTYVNSLPLLFGGPTPSFLRVDELWEDDVDF